MIKKSEKSGQFYLISVIILSSVIISVALIPNYLDKKKNVDFYDFKDEISVESKKTMEYGLNNSFTSQQMNSLMQNFTREYIKKRLSGMSLYFMFGNLNNFTLRGFQEKNDSVFINSGSSILVTQTPGNFSGSVDPSSSVFNLTVNGNSFYFNISSAENFHFVIKQNYSEEEYLEKG